MGKLSEWANHLGNLDAAQGRFLLPGRVFQVAEKV